MLEEFPYFLPIDFFEVSIDVNYAKKRLDKKHLLFDSSAYLGEKEKSPIYMGWNEKALLFKIISKKLESVELFIDTKGLKSNYITKFCHHFLILPDEKKAKEITRFRDDDMHKIANDFPVSYSGNSLDITIESSSLYRYDKKEIKFSYILNKEDAIEHFSASSFEVKLEKEPILWASCKLKKYS